MSEPVAVVGEYYRSRDGKTIHWAPCPRMAKSAVRWNYADGKSLHEVVAEVRAIPWMKLCGACWPAGALREAS